MSNAGYVVNEEPEFVDTIPTKIYVDGAYAGRLRQFPNNGAPRYTDPLGVQHATLDAAVKALLELPEGATRDAYSGDEPEHQSRARHGAHIERA